MYDAIIVGSRVAGAPTAMLLARAGRRVLVVERSTFPSDVLSGHTFQPDGVARLARWGLLDRVRETGVPFADRVRFDFGPVVLEGSPLPIDGISAALCIRRTVIDPLLTDAAIEAGAEVRFGFTVNELIIEGGGGSPALVVTTDQASPSRSAPESWWAPTAPAASLLAPSMRRCPTGGRRAR